MQNEMGRKDFCKSGDNNSKSSQVSTTHIAKADTHTILQWLRIWDLAS